MSNGFYKNRRLKTFLFCAACLFVYHSTFIAFQKFLLRHISISFLIACYGLNIILKTKKELLVQLITQEDLILNYQCWIFWLLQEMKKMLLKD